MRFSVCIQKNASPEKKKNDWLTAEAVLRIMAAHNGPDDVEVAITLAR